MAILAWLLGAALSASAHDFYPIRPVRVTLRVEPDRVVADLQADSIIWIEEVTGLHPMPASDWPAETASKVEVYVNDHLRLAADGKFLSGKLLEARYRQLPWEVNEEGVFLLRLVYPAIAAEATLTGTARFYEEYRMELVSELGNRPLPFANGYRTMLDIPGRRKLNFILTPDAPSFTASATNAQRSAFAMALESLALGAKTVVGTAAGFPVLLAVALCLGVDAPSSTLVLLLLSGVSVGFAAGQASTAPTWLAWAALLVGAFGAGRSGSRFAASAALAGLVWVWSSANHPLLPHSAVAFPFALTGTLASAAALLFAIQLGVRSEQRRLREVSESRVDVLFARQVRLTATALIMIGAYGLWQSLKR